MIVLGFIPPCEPEPIGRGLAVVSRNRLLPTRLNFREIFTQSKK